MLKFLFFTAVRVSELVKIKVGDVDLGSCKVFIDRGKGAKDRYILFPAGFRLVLKSHLHANPQNRYLFETRLFGPFTARRIQQIVQKYREQAGLRQHVHPHLFRHQILTFLTSRGLSDTQILLEAVNECTISAVEAAPGGKLMIAGGRRKPTRELVSERSPGVVTRGDAEIGARGAEPGNLQGRRGSD